MSRGEIRLTGSEKQTRALKLYVEKYYPEFESVQEFMKDSFELRTGVKWNEIQKIMRVK
jgi:hypothetical protein